MQIGAWYTEGDLCEFTVWAPNHERVALCVESPESRIIEMTKDDRGYWRAAAAAPPGARYRYALSDDRRWPDPASQWQPEGVHAASATVDHRAFSWSDASWRGRPIEEYVIYEMHPGAFTPGGDFDAARGKLNYLVDLGVTAVEIMPVAQFPGERNWGYDGVYPFAVQNSYGGPASLKQFVDACHRAGLSVILDVVYNHLGPEGNYLWQYGPYFTTRYCTPWGEALNFDDAYSYGVRDYFAANAVFWMEQYHIDALRLDAVHGIYDFGAKHILAEIAEAVHALRERNGRSNYLIAESDLNDTRLITSPARGGFGLDAQWSDDFHHALHTVLTGERRGYYEDFGSLEDLAKAFSDGFVYDWRYSKHRKRRHGSSSAQIPGSKLVACIQNHDQVGNRMLGERLSSLVSFDSLKAAACALLTAPYIPLLFMGEEYGETNPFLYFVSHTDPDLIEAVRKGRREEFAAFQWEGEPPDPESEETFLRSNLDWARLNHESHALLHTLYRRLIALRKELPALRDFKKENVTVRSVAKDVLAYARGGESNAVVCLLNVGSNIAEFDCGIVCNGSRKILDTADERWGGPGSPLPELLNADQNYSLSPQSFALIIEE